MGDVATHHSRLKAPAAAGFANAAAYDAHRPSYPAEAVDLLLQKTHIADQRGARILELGAGTGKFTRLLAARPENYAVCAIEPHEAMRLVLEHSLDPNTSNTSNNNDKMNSGDDETSTTAQQRVSIRPGSVGTDKGLDHAVDNGWADAVIVAQAFHWFATRPALEDIHRKLMPGGYLGLIWNIEDYNAPQDWQLSTKWERELNRIMWQLEDTEPRFRHDKWRAVFDDQLRSTPLSILGADPLFSLPLGEQHVPFTVWLTKQGVWDRFHTISYVAVLQGDKLEEVKRQVFAAMEGLDVEHNENGEVALHGRTVVVWTSSIPQSTATAPE